MSVGRDGYNGTLLDGTYGTGYDTKLFKPGMIDSAFNTQSGMYTPQGGGIMSSLGLGNFASGDFGKFLLGGQTKGANGSITTSMGAAPLALSAFNTWANYANGKEMAEIAQDKLDTQKKLGFTNLAMELDKYGMAKNKISKFQYQYALRDENGFLGRENADRLNQQYNRGDGFVNRDNSIQRVDNNIPDEYKLSDSYGQQQAGHVAAVEAGSQAGPVNSQSPAVNQQAPVGGQTPNPAVRYAGGSDFAKKKPIPGSTAAKTEKPQPPAKLA